MITHLLPTLRRLTTGAAIGVAGLAVLAPNAAGAVPIGPPDVHLTNVTFHGDCDRSNTTMALENNNTALTVAKSHFVVEVGRLVGPGGQPTWLPLGMRTCRVTATVQSPGWTVAVTTPTTVGYANLEAGSTARYQGALRLTGADGVARASWRGRGPFTGDYQTAGEMSTGYAPCGVEPVLTVVERAMITAGESPERASILTADDLIADLRWRKC